MTAFTGVVIWSVVLAVSLVTYALRASFLLGIDYVESFPPTVDRLIAFFPIAVLSALVAPSLLLVDGSLAVGLDNVRLIAGVVGFAVAWYTESILATVGVGMVVLWGLTGVP